MGKDLRGKSLGVGISQRKDGLYMARFISKQTGKRIQKNFSKLQECRNWYAEAIFQDEHGGINASGDMTVTTWFEYWIENIKGDSIRPELIGLKWSDIDFEKKVMHIQRSMEYRYKVGEWRIGEPATRCIEGGMRPKTLQILLGHSNISITMNLYVHVTDDEMVNELEKVEDILKMVQ